MLVLSYARQSRDPNVKMVLFEDSAALVGNAIAAAGIGAQAITGVQLWDPVASIMIGVLLVSVAVWMARDARHLLIGAAARVGCVNPIVRRRTRSHPTGGFLGPW